MDLGVKIETTEDEPLSHSSENVKQEDIFEENYTSQVNALNCSMCEYSTPNKSNFKRHQQFKHKLSVPEPLLSQIYSCSECKYITSNKSNLSRHRSTHKDIKEQFHPSDIEFSGNPSLSQSQEISESVKLEPSEIPQVVKIFNCQLCDYSTNDKGNFKRHHRCKHKISTVQPFSVSECGYTIKTETDQISQVDEETAQSQESKTNISTPSISCQFCEFRTEWTSIMIKHVEATHSEVSIDIPNFKSCKFCAFTTKCRKKLKQHKKREHQNLLTVFSCSECSFTSNWEESMKLHKKFHGVMKDYPGVKCEYCDFMYKHHPADQRGMRKCKQTLNEHMNDEHEEQKLKCDLCEKSVWTHQQLKVHKTRHEHSQDDGNFSCDQCDYKCTKAHRLKVHIDTVHLGVKKHLCEWCPAAFATTSSLNKHILSHTDERNFQCQFCKKAFHTKGNLEKHIRTHTGEKPFTCDVCGKSFSDQSYFVKHKRLHDTGPSGKPVKDFMCQICSKGFTRRSYLESHLVTHLNQNDGRPVKYSNEFKMEAVNQAKVHGIHKAASDMCVNRNTLKNWVKLSVHPHICSLCGKAFSYEAQLKRHVLTHPDDGLEGPVKSNIRYEDVFKKEVAHYALENTIQEAIKRFELPHSTINNWMKRISNPRPCHLCGKSFANDSTVRRHIEQVHKNTPEGAEELRRRTEEVQNSQPFSEFLAENHLLPSEEQIQEISREKERKREEKEEFALLAQQFMSREKEKKAESPVTIMDKNDMTEELNMNIFSPITCLTVPNDDHQESELTEGVKTEALEKI